MLNLVILHSELMQYLRLIGKENIENFLLSFIFLFYLGVRSVFCHLTFFAELAATFTGA